MENLNAKAKALANFLGKGIVSYNESTNIFSVNDEECHVEEYYVFTDDEANKRVEEYIKETLWAFNPKFIHDMTNIDERMIRVIVNECENSNEVIEKLIIATCGIDKFIQKAVECDGRGHFINTWDGEENEEDGYLIYRIG